MITLQDLDCPVCQEMIIQPVRLPKCNHLFCSTCIQTLYDSLGELFKCPLCRKEQYIYPKPPVDQQMMKQIKKTYPRYFDKRKLEQDQLNKQLYGDDYHLEINYGYMQKRVASKKTNKTIWVTFVKIVNSYHTFKKLPFPNEIIKRVLCFCDFDYFDCRCIKKEPYSLEIKNTNRENLYIILEFLPIYKSKYNLQNLQLKVPLSFNGGGKLCEQKLVLTKGQKQQHKST
ncbi:hypothetical protein pb186bvf_018197 [Paramecium bursaria]